MKKHQYVKKDCDCPRRATYFICKHCGAVEFGGPDEVRALDGHRAACTGAGAPEASPAEMFKSRLGGAFDCLAPDYATWDRENKAAAGG